MITTSDFIGLFSKSNILALIVMAIIAGVAIGQSDQAGKRIASLLEDANTVIMKIVSIIMKVAPIGLGCYFAATMASQDSALLLTFARAIGLFMVATLVYFVLAQFSIRILAAVFRRSEPSGVMRLSRLPLRWGPALRWGRCR